MDGQELQGRGWDDVGLLLSNYAQAAEKFEAVLALDELSLKVSRVCHARGLIPFSRATFRV